MFAVVFAVGGTASALDSIRPEYLLGLVALLVLPPLIAWLTIRYIPNQSVGVVEKLWSAKGSIPEGRIIALDGEAGYQADLLRGGIHFGLWRGQYPGPKAPPLTIPPGENGDVYAPRRGKLPPSQTPAPGGPGHNIPDPPPLPPPWG